MFEDVSGGIVVSFDAVRGVAEGDLSAYMQNLARNHALVSEGEGCVCARVQGM